MLDFENYPIIAAVRTHEEFVRAINSDLQTVFLLSVNIGDVRGLCDEAHKKQKLLFVHMDFVDGLSKDAAGVRYLASKGIDGIISTRSNIICAAVECSLPAVQRFFMIDSRSVDTALETLKTSKATMVEIMPGIAYKAIEKMRLRTKIPIIAGGLIGEKAEIIQALKCGAAMVSTGECKLWDE